MPQPSEALGAGGLAPRPRVLVLVGYYLPGHRGGGPTRSVVNLVQGGKVVIVDDIWSIVGSVNFDERSLRINDEANLNVLDRAFAAQLIKTFEDDKDHSLPLELKDFRKRNIFLRASDHFIGLFRSQL